MSFRGLLYFIFFFAASLWVWERAITQDGLPLYLDKHPTTWKADAIYYTLGSFHELFNRDERALEQYERVLEKFPKSPYAESALYGVGACHERLKHWD
jgi:TolA-binding protein